MVNSTDKKADRNTLVTFNNEIGNFTKYIKSVKELSKLKILRLLSTTALAKIWSRCNLSDEFSSMSSGTFIKDTIFEAIS